jgi:hypothetical protein
MGRLSDTLSQRTARLALCRNKAMQRCLEIGKDYDYRYCLVIDMDDCAGCMRDMQGVKSNFLHKDWAVMACSNPTAYYDIWALRRQHVMEYDCWEAIDHDRSQGKTYEEAVQQHVGIPMKTGATPVDHCLIEVYSAFNGAAFYDLTCITPEDVYMGTTEQGREVCEHVSFHKSIKSRGGKIYINPRFVIDKTI